MADVKAIISELASVGAEGPPIVTLYLDTRWADEHQRERVRLFFNDRAREARALFSTGDERARGVLDTLDTLAAYVDRLVNQDLHEAAGGVMLVASEPRELFVELAIPEPFEPAMFVDDRPRVGPLLEVVSRLRPALLVEVDSSGAEILRWELGAIVEEHSLEREVPNRHKQGGWSQRRFQQHVRAVIRGVWRQCADLLSGLAREMPDDSIVLFGQEANVRGFAALLPAEVAARVVAELPAPPRGDKRKLLAAARAALRDEQIAYDFDSVHRIIRQGLSDRSGVLGLEDTLLASNERRLRVLALSPRFRAGGWRCTSCEGLWVTGSTACTFCGAATEAVNLREEVLRRCAREGAEVIVVPDGGPLDAYRGVGGLLRHLSGEERQRLGSVSPSRAPRGAAGTRPVGSPAGLTP